MIGRKQNSRTRVTGRALAIVAPLLMAVGSARAAQPAPAPADGPTSPTVAEWILPVGASPADVSAGRIIAASFAVTDILFALGAGERVVAVDLTGAQVPAAARLPRVGYIAQLAPEGLLAQRPTLILAGERIGPATTVEQMRGAGIPIAVLHGDGDADLALARVAAIARLVEREAEGERLVQSIRSELDRARAIVDASGRRPRVLFLLAQGPGRFMAAGRATGADTMIKLAGGENICAGFEGYKSIGPESIVAGRPEWILAASTGGSEEAIVQSMKSDAALGLTAAVREGRVVVRPAGALLNYGSGLGAAVLDLARKLHGAEVRP